MLALSDYLAIRTENFNLDRFSAVSGNMWDESGWPQSSVPLQRNPAVALLASEPNATQLGPSIIANPNASSGLKSSIQTKRRPVKRAATKSPYQWTTGGMRNITHVDLINRGGYGEVHQVR